jgi:hypothetical protein
MNLCISAAVDTHSQLFEFAGLGFAVISQSQVEHWHVTNACHVAGTTVRRHFCPENKIVLKRRCSSWNVKCKTPWLDLSASGVAGCVDSTFIVQLCCDDSGHPELSRL